MEQTAFFSWTRRPLQTSISSLSNTPPHTITSSFSQDECPSQPQAPRAHCISIIFIATFSAITTTTARSTPRLQRPPIPYQPQDDLRPQPKPKQDSGAQPRHFRLSLRRDDHVRTETGHWDPRLGEEVVTTQRPPSSSSMSRGRAFPMPTDEVTNTKEYDI